MIEFRNRLVAELALSPAQADKVDAIYAEARPRFMALRDMTAEERPKARERISADIRARIADVLTAEQKTKYAALVAALAGRQSTRGRIYLMGADGKPVAGLQAVSDFMEGNVPEAEREKASEVLIRILNGVLFELVQTSRLQAGLPALELDDRTQNYMSQAVLSLSDAFHYPAPMTFELKSFEQVQASVFQVARAPGRNIVYLGCLFLIIGIFAMLYVRERRLWIWLAPRGDGSQATMALSTNRKTMDGDKEFDHLASRLLKAPS